MDYKKTCNTNHGNYSKIWEDLFGVGINIINDNLAKTGDYKSFPPTNLSESENGYSVEVRVPGIDKNQIKIVTENNSLTISYENKEEVKEDKKYLLKEFRLRNFSRTFKLKDNMDLSKIDASCHNGILSIFIPKAVTKETEKIQVEIK